MIQKGKQHLLLVHTILGFNRFLSNSWHFGSRFEDGEPVSETGSNKTQLYNSHLLLGCIYHMLISYSSWLISWVEFTRFCASCLSFGIYLPVTRISVQHLQSWALSPRAFLTQIYSNCQAQYAGIYACSMFMICKGHQLPLPLLQQQPHLPQNWLVIYRWYCQMLRSLCQRSWV